MKNLFDSREEEEKAIHEMNGKMNIFKIEELIRRTLNQTRYFR